MTRLVCVAMMLCGVSSLHADQTVRSLQQTLKQQGCYYGKVTGQKSAETTAAIRRYQIRNGLKVTGALNDETTRSLNAIVNSLAELSQTTTTKPEAAQIDRGSSGRDGTFNQQSPRASVRDSDRQMETSPPYATRLSQLTSVLVN